VDDPRPIENTGFMVDAGALDRIDNEITRQLSVDGRITNKKIAKSLGISEPTVAARIRSLIDRDVLKIVAQRSLHSARLPGIAAIIDIEANGVSSEIISEASSKIIPIYSVYEIASRPEYVASIQVDNLSELNAVSRDIDNFDTRIDIVVSIITELVLYKIQFFAPYLNSTPSAMGDSVRDKMIGLLEEDGRQSVRTLAGKLGLAETSVRQRLQKLQSTPEFKIAAVVNPFAIGLPAWYELRLSVRFSDLEHCIEALKAENDIFILAKTTGHYNVYAFIVSESAESAEDFIVKKVRSISGLNKISYTRVLRSLKYNYSYHM
jgi:Lrp/AsnC family transcriptional regulator, regulator for asnA, asnC and gidA